MRASLVLIFIQCFFMSCAGIFHNRSFIGQMDKQDPYYAPGKDFPLTSGDSGKVDRNKADIESRTPISRHDIARTQESRMLSSERASLEAKLRPQERANYETHSHYLETDSEKIYYLKLAEHKRIDYLASRRLASTGPHLDYGNSGVHRKPASVLDRELFLGMGKEAVVQSWGRPHRVDIAGNPRHENERWSFYVNGQVKSVYFESGKVQGWVAE